MQLMYSLYTLYMSKFASKSAGMKKSSIVYHFPAGIPQSLNKFYRYTELFKAKKSAAVHI